MEQLLLDNVIALTSYIALVRLFPYRRMAKIEAPFANCRIPLSNMTVKEAHAVTAELQEMGFPYAFAKAREMALLIRHIYLIRISIHVELL